MTDCRHSIPYSRFRFAATNWLHRPLDLGPGMTRYQGAMGTCAPHAIANVAEQMDLPHVHQLDIYRAAKHYDLIPDATQSGTHLWACAEAYCELAGGGIKWTRLPLDADAIGRWMLSRQSAVALSMRWYEADMHPGWGKIVEGGAGKETSLHAVSLHGFEPEYKWRRFPIFGRLRKAPVFILENSAAPFPIQRMPMARIARDGIEAIALVRTGKEGV